MAIFHWFFIDVLALSEPAIVIWNALLLPLPIVVSTSSIFTTPSVTIFLSCFGRDAHVLGKRGIDRDAGLGQLLKVRGVHAAGVDHPAAASSVRVPSRTSRRQHS
ncbi:hypothetical protein [Pseudonocardia sp. ICBG1142]|uniref:hypothetical protein n=1 Tax=Pseudonocardia sp. ICBG1142 TaxID=2846760 RepID=UPI001CF6EA02|nr:hypothetical protein [Pseudonocardia sp. ICBG1142]